MLGLREPEIYGDQTLDDIKGMCAKWAQSHDAAIDFKQSNHEGEIVTWIQEAHGAFDGVVINAAAYTHTSIAIHDALKILDMPIIEVHLSEPKEREEFRHYSYIEPVAAHVITGQGGKGYLLALEKLAEVL